MQNVKNKDLDKVNNTILLHNTRNHLMVVILNKDITTMTSKCNNSVFNKDNLKLSAIGSLNYMVYMGIDRAEKLYQNSQNLSLKEFKMCHPTRTYRRLRKRWPDTNKSPIFTKDIVTFLQTIEIEISLCSRTLIVTLK